MSPSRLYFDAHATTPCDPLVVEAMLPYFTERFGNAASQQHAYGWDAHAAVESARQHVATLVGARVRDVIFTSGATEANTLALRGAIEATGWRPTASAAFAPVPSSSPRARGKPPDSTPPHIVTVVTEHSAVLGPCAWLQAHGIRITRVPVRRDGLVDLDAMATAITPDTVLVSVMAANKRDWRAPAARVDRVARARRGCVPPLRRHAGGRQGAAGHAGGGHRPAVLQRTSCMGRRA